MNNHVACCIVSWCNTEKVFKLLQETIQSVFQNNSDYYNLSYSLIIVDNNSQFPAMEEYLKSLEAMNVAVIRNKENFGYAIAANQGMRLASSYADWVIMLNSDAICTPGLFHTMVCCAESDDKIAAVGCKVLKPGTDMVIHSGTVCDKGQILNPYNPESFFHTPKKVTEERLWVNGCCVLFKSDVLKKEGYFDESYKLYFEEAKYMTNLVKKGYRVVCCDAAVIYHYERQSALQDEAGTAPQFYASWERFYAEHKDFLVTHVTQKMPVVHIVVPCHNSEKYLVKTLNSIYGQTYQYLKVWLVDDCSTDSTPESLKQYSKANPKAVILKTPTNMGVSAARNLAIDEIMKVADINNDIIKFLDSDDILRPDALDKMVWQFQLNRDLVFFCSDVSYEFEDGKPALPFGIKQVSEFNLDSLLESNFIYTSSVAHKVSAIAKTGLRFERGIESIEDWNYWATLTTGLRDNKNSCMWYPEKLVTYIVKYTNNVAAQSNVEKYAKVREKMDALKQLIKGETTHA